MTDLTSRSLAIATLAALLALTGCTSTSGSGSGAAASSAPANSTGTPPTSSAAAPSSAPPASQTAPASSVPATHTSSPAGPQGCAAKQLNVSGGPLPGGSAAGHTGVLLMFVNTSARACTLFGYPGVDGLTPGGKDIASATRTFNGYLGGCKCTSLHSVTLSPGGKASAITEGTIGSGNCDRFGSLLVTPPNTATSTEIDLAPHSCQFTVHPVVAGTTGDG
jgi:hypothetical protein